jgi:inner membrane protein
MAFLSLLPDLDALFGVLLGSFARRHNNISHSVTFGVLAGVIAGLIARVTDRHAFFRWFSISFVSYSLHLLLDYWSTRRGLLLLWPLSGRRFVAPVKLFYGFRWSEKLVSRHHVRTVVTELLFALLVVTLARILFETRGK